MKKLVSLLALFMLIVSMASARTLIVNKSGDPDTYLSPVDAALVSVPGDTILINEAGNYTNMGATIPTSTTALVLNGVTLKGGTNPRPMITVQAHSVGGITVHNSSIENIM